MQAQVSDVPYLAASFKDGGPFFISVLFVVIVSGWAAHLYRVVCERKDPPPTPEERNTYRLYFFYAVAVGAIATGVSLWWWVSHESVYTLRGSIRGLTSAEAVWSEDVFFKPRFSRGGQEGRAEEFIIVKNQPFKAGEEYVISYQKTGGDTEDLTFKYSGTRPDFRVTFKDGRNLLQPVIAAAAPATQTARWDFSILQSAYAGITERRPPQQAMILIGSDEASLTRALQDDRLYVGTEIKALDVLRRKPFADRQRFAGSTGRRELMIITLLDLTRHEDPEVAYKANEVLKGVNAPDILRSKLTTPTGRRTYSAALTRVERSMAEQATRSLGVTIALKPIPRLLRATPAGDGDEFWVTGVAKTPAAAKCIADRLFAQPDTSMPGKARPASAGNRVTTYSYSKEWVASAADGIEQCGGTPMFGRAMFKSAS